MIFNCSTLKLPNKMNIFYLHTLILLFISLFSCDTDDTEISTKRDITWLYQLQSGNIQDIEESGFSLVVTDYSPDGSDINKYSAEQIGHLTDSSIIPLAYISIGEAENYRFYWDQEWVQTHDQNDFSADAPSWLGHTNPGWTGNYKVRYWDPDWKESCIKPYLDKIIAQGFQGVYLDIIDAFQYWSDPDNYGPEKEQILEGDPIDNEADAADKMINLVLWIADYCRSQSVYSSDFLVFPQNGESIFDYDNINSYMNTISGIGAESIWYHEITQNDINIIEYRLAYLRNVVSNNKQVLAVDYIDEGSGFINSNRERILDFINKCTTENFLYYVARSDRQLNIINTIKSVQP